MIERPYLDNPFQRFNANIEKYPDFHEDLDDICFMTYDNWERFKPFDPKPGTTFATTNAIPLSDNED